MEIISEGSWIIFKNEDFGFDIFEKGQILRPFSGLALKMSSKDFNVSIILSAYRVFYIPISEESKGGGGGFPPPPGPYGTEKAYSWEGEMNYFHIIF